MSTPLLVGPQKFPFGVSSTTGTTCIAERTLGVLGSKVVSYTPTYEVDGGNSFQPAGKLQSISAMPVYDDESHEELRWADYQMGIARNSSGVQKFSFGTTTMFNIPNTSQSPFGGQSERRAVHIPGRNNFVCGSSTQSASKFDPAIPVFSSTQSDPKLLSISAMPVYKDNCHEELRWEDYQMGRNQSIFRDQISPFGIPSRWGTSGLDQDRLYPGGPRMGTREASYTPTVKDLGFRTPPAENTTSGFKGQLIGSLLVGYTPTDELESGSKLQSISAMPAYKYKAHEEVRWEDYQLGNKGRPGSGLESPVNVVPAGLADFLKLSAASVQPPGSPAGSSFPASSKPSAASVQPPGPPASFLFPRDSKPLFQSAESVQPPRPPFCHNCLKKQAGSGSSDGKTSQTNAEQVSTSLNAPVIPDLITLSPTQPENSPDKQPCYPSETNQINDNVPGVDIESLTSNLGITEGYYIMLSSLTAKKNIKDIVIGRHGYGSIKFTEEMKIIGLDVESLVQFNHHGKVVVKMTTEAEVTLVDIFCIDKKTGVKYTEGSKVEKYEKLLVKSAEEQGGEHVSYDPVKGEWKFKVNVKHDCQEERKAV